MRNAIIQSFYKASRLFYQWHLYSIARIISEILYILYGIEISPAAVIHKTVRFPHPNGVIIGGDCIIEEGVRISQSVTLGGNLGKEKNDRKFPIIRSHSWILKGALICGGVEVHSHSIIAPYTKLVKTAKSSGLIDGNPGDFVRHLSVYEIERMTYVSRKAK